MSVNDACDELAAILEPDPALRDGSCAHPSSWAPDVLYVWPAREAVARLGTRDDTAADLWSDATIRVAWATDRAGEAPDQPDREVSDRIAARLEACLASLRAARQSGAHYADASFSGVDYERPVTLDVRGFTATISCKVQRTV